MFKKSFLSLMAVVALFATSCQKEAFVEEPLVAEEATVSFNIGTPDIATRAYSDGSTATQLQYAVYDAAGNILNDLTETDATINGNTTVDLKLTTGNTYDVIFWAAAPGAPYTVDFATTLAEANMTVNYNGALSNDEARDAFFVRHTFEVKGAQTETVELRRPFAQLNIGTNDLEDSKDAGYEPTMFKVVVDAYSELNFSTGNVIGDAATVTFDYAALPTGETFPVTGYDYLAMNYLLMPADQETVDVEFSYKNAAGDEKTRTIGSVPVRRNYRTNLYGQILTSDVEINVEIKPEYDGSLEAALQTAATFGGEVTLTENVELPKTLVVAEGAHLVINLNGKTISNNSTDLGYGIADVIVVYGELTIKGEGTVTGPTRCVWARGNTGAKVNIEGGHYIGATADSDQDVAIYASGNGVVTINGGTFETVTPDTESYATDIHSVLNVYDRQGTIVVYGGTFKGQNPADAGTEPAGYNNFVAEGYVSSKVQVDGEDAWVVSELKEVAVETNDQLIQALADPAVTVIDIKSDLAIGTSTGVKITTDKVINGNNFDFTAGGYVTSGSGAYAFVFDGANVTINDLNINPTEGNCGGIYVSNSSDVALNNVSLNVRNTSGRHMFYVVGNSSLTINATTFTFKQKTKGYLVYASDSEVYINGGNWIEYSADRRIYGSTVKISGGTFKFDPTSWVADGYQAVPNGSKWEVVTK